jgi:glycosyltransferase involved in cell wall biosynthesis/GT2 family glycosyltransferase
VLHLAAGRAFGGVETLLLTLHDRADCAPRLKQEFAFLYSGSVVARRAEREAVIHTVGPVRARRPWAVARALAALGSLQRRHRYDVVVCHGAWIQGLFGSGLRALGPRVATWVHSVPRRPGWEEQLARLSRPGLAIFNSRYTAQCSRRLYPHVRQAVIYPPVTAHEPRAPDVRRTIRAALGVAPTEIAIVLVGRFDRAKGHLLFVEALSRLSGEWKAWIVGGAQTAADHAYRNEVEARVTELGLGDRITFLGDRTDARDYLLAADLYCQPNLAPEGFGIAFVEALYAGLPVITTAMGGGLEIVDETCGVVVDCDSRSVAAALERLIRNHEERARLAAAAPQRAARLCDPAERLRELEAMLLILRPLGGSDATRRPPRISVLVPSRGRPSKLVQCLRALDAQTLKPAEIVVGTRADDHETAEVIASVAPSLGVELQRATTRRLGVCASMNAALAHCRGELIAITDDDAEPFPDWLERLACCFDDTRVGGAGGRDIQPLERGQRATVGRVQWFGRVIGNHHLGVGTARPVDMLKGVNCAFRAPLLRACGFDPRLAGRGMQTAWELSLCLPLRRSGWELIYDPSIQVLHHVSPRNVDDPDRLHRGVFAPGPHADAVYNATLALLESRSRAGRLTFLLWALLVGTSDEPGFLQLPRIAGRGEAGVIERWRATVAGRWRGYLRFRAERGAVP